MNARNRPLPGLPESDRNPRRRWRVVWSIVRWEESNARRQAPDSPAMDRAHAALESRFSVNYCHDARFGNLIGACDARELMRARNTYY